ncbi:MAG: WD40 repeat domain-containing protein [Acetobacteraceae bacterium]|jgi:WD40 repeat protein
MGKNDFFGDGRSDMILQNADGSVVLWDMSGISIVDAGLVGNPGASWTVEGTAGGTSITPGGGSFTDAAGRVFTISTAGIATVNGSPLALGGGTAKLEYYDGVVYGQDVATGSWYILDADLSWSPSVAPGLFGDGRTAIVMQNADGSVVLWDMSGSNIVNAGLVAGPMPTWHVKGTGGFFPGGSTAIVLQNDDGSVVLWDMRGAAIVNAGLVAGASTYQVKGTGAFFGYGSTGIIMQNNDGSVVLWDVSGSTIVDAGLVAGASTYQVKGTGNFFGDGNTDLVMQSTDGSVVLWDVSGTTIVNAGSVGNPGPAWHVKGTGDFFGDGHTDLVMQNADGSVVLWDMSGSAIINAGVVGNPGASWNVLDDNMRFIYSTSANETLTATPAAPDEFVLTGVTTGLHTISGFNPAQDMIELSKAQFPSFTDVQAATSVSSGVTTINLGGGSLLLPGVNADLLHASNFALT